MERQICPYFRQNRCRYGEQCNLAHPNREICRYFLAGHCRYGQNCKYGHPGQPQPQIRPPFNMRTQNQPPQRHSQGFPRPNFGRNRSGFSTSSSSATSNFVLSPNAKPFVPRNLKSTSSGPGTSRNCWSKPPLHSQQNLPTQQQENPSICPYYEMTGQCFDYEQGRCLLIHGDFCDLCARFCLNPFDERQRKAHHRECVEEHEKAMKDAFANQLSAEKTCGICMENVYEQAQRFGILNKCKHAYCLRCIRAWRKTQGPMQRETTRACPQCRIVSDFVVPSELWVEDDKDKEDLIRTYHKNMKQKVCKYMQKGNVEDCPFGNKCFYRHQLPNDDKIFIGPPRPRRRGNNSSGRYHNMSIEEFLDAAPNLRLIRIGVGEEALGTLLEELELGELDRSFFITPDSSDYEPPTGEEEDFDEEYELSYTLDE